MGRGAKVRWKRVFLHRLCAFFAHFGGFFAILDGGKRFCEERQGVNFEENHGFSGVAVLGEVGSAWDRVKSVRDG